MSIAALFVENYMRNNIVPMAVEIVNSRNGRADLDINSDKNTIVSSFNSVLSVQERKNLENAMRN